MTNIVASHTDRGARHFVGCRSPPNSLDHLATTQGPTSALVAAVRQPTTTVRDYDIGRLAAWCHSPTQAIAQAGPCCLVEAHWIVRTA